jgi:hypothetical protein
MTAEQAKALKKGERVVARYDDDSEHQGTVHSHENGELVIAWETPRARPLR